MSEYVTCSVCEKTYVGRIPKNGDGSALFTRLHYESPPPTITNLGIMIAKYKSKKVYCRGSFIPVLVAEAQKEQR